MGKQEEKQRAKDRGTPDDAATLEAVGELQEREALVGAAADTQANN